MSIYSDDASAVNAEVAAVNAEVAAAELEVPAFLSRKRAVAARPKPINVAYVRSDDGADMIEIGSHQVASLDAMLARRLAPSSIKAVEAA
jgi:hypothetical protein